MASPVEVVAVEDHRPGAPTLTTRPPLVKTLAETTQDGLGPAICATCGAVVGTSADPVGAVASVLLSLLASISLLLALVSLVVAIAGTWVYELSLTEALPFFLVALGAALAGLLAGWGAQVTERRPHRRPGACAFCGEALLGWESPRSERAAFVVTLVAGPLLVPGLFLMALALSGMFREQWPRTVAELVMGLVLVSVAVAIARRPWFCAHGTDLAFASTWGRAFLWGEGVGTPRALSPVPAAALPVLSALPQTGRDHLAALASLVEKQRVTLATRNDLVWKRVLAFHRVQLHRAAVFVEWDPAAPRGESPQGLEAALLGELQNEARELAAGAGEPGYRLATELASPVRLPLVELLRRVGLDPEAAKTAEAAFRRGLAAPRKFSSLAGRWRGLASPGPSMSPGGAQAPTPDPPQAKQAKILGKSSGGRGGGV